METVQFADGRSEEGQVLVSAKSAAFGPTKVIPVMLTEAAPLVRMVSVCAGEENPLAVGGKDSEVGENCNVVESAAGIRRILKSGGTAVSCG